MDNIQALKDAQQQSKNNKLLGPGHFFFIPKTTVSIQGYREAEVFSMTQLLEYIDKLKQKFKGTIPELAIQKKFDGVTVEIHRSSNKITMFTEQGNNITNRMPTFVKKILKDLPNENFIIIGEIEQWINDKHLGRSAIAGYLNAKTAPDDSNLVISLFDVVWYGNKDIHGEDYCDRYEYFKNFNLSQSVITKPKPGSFNLALTFVSQEKIAIQHAVKKVSKPNESEGAVLKFWKGFKFNLNKFTGEMIKFKKFAEGHFIVLSKRRISGSDKTYQYEFGVKVRASELGSVDGSKIIEYDNQNFLRCGKTFNTNIGALVGDILTIRFSNLNLYHNRDDKIYFGVYSPIVYENRTQGKKDEELDTVATLLEIGKESGLLLEKGIGIYVSKAMDVFLKYPEEDLNLEYVMQEHFRNLSAHLDFRIEIKPGGDLIGYTVMNQIAGKIDKPVETVEQGKKYLQDDSNWKFNPLTCYFQQRETAAGIRKASIQCALKTIEPGNWKNIEGVTAIGEVGATKKYPGVFVIASQGKIEYGFREPYFHEYYVYNDNWPNGGSRLVFRLLASEILHNNKMQFKSIYGGGLESPLGRGEIFDTEYMSPLHTGSNLRGWPLAPIVYEINSYDDNMEWGLGYFDRPIGYEITRHGQLYKILPPGEESSKETPFIWLMIQPNSLEPYILSSRAHKKEKFPPLGISAIPKHIRNQVPVQYRYWDTSSQEEMKTKLNLLREAIKSKKIILEYSEKIFKKQVIVKSNDNEFETLNYVLKKRFWRDPVTAQLDAFIILYDLFVEQESHWMHFVLLKNLIDIDSVAGYQDQNVSEKDACYEGKLEPEHRLNLNKEISAQVQILTKGQLFLKEVELSFWLFNFSSGKLSGKFFKALRDANIWKFELNDN